MYLNISKTSYSINFYLYVTVLDIISIYTVLKVFIFIVTLYKGFVMLKLYNTSSLQLL